MTGQDSDRTGRGQSEMVGISLLTGVTVIVGMLVGTAIIANVASQAETAPTADIELELTGTDVTLIHNGGATFKISNVVLVVEQDGDANRIDPGPGDTSDGDKIVEPGQSITVAHGHGSGTVTVMLVHQPTNEFVFKETAEIP